MVLSATIAIRGTRSLVVVFRRAWGLLAPFPGHAAVGRQIAGGGEADQVVAGLEEEPVLADGRLWLATTVVVRPAMGTASPGATIVRGVVR